MCLLMSRWVDGGCVKGGVGGWVGWVLRGLGAALGVELDEYMGGASSLRLGSWNHVWSFVASHGAESGIREVLTTHCMIFGPSISGGAGRAYATHIDEAA